MSTVNLLQPILDGGVQRNNFFNGRLLSAEDLRAEQDANRAQRSQLAQALGDGVASGLEVSIISATARTVRVRGDLAINRRLDLLSLADDTDVTLVPTPPSATANGSGVFGECEPPRASIAYTGAGVYVLVGAPASGYSGSALISDVNTTSAGRGTCGARFSVEGFRFRLVPMELMQLSGLDAPLVSRIASLLPPSTTGARERLRNALTHLCLGTQAIHDYFLDPLGPIGRETTWAGWGALDAMRARGDLTDCDVPLALVVLTSTGISLVDNWSVRRKLVGAGSISTWRGVAGPRRMRDAEAAFLQFQSQLEIVRSLEPSASIAAPSYFELLPPAGWLPTDGAGFNWKTFLGTHAPNAVTPVDAALVRGIIERSWLDDPFALATAPPVPLRVFEVPGASYVVFARSQLGNVRVALSPEPTATQQFDVVLTARTGSSVHGSTRESARVTVPEVQPGTHDLTIVAPDYLPVAAREVQVVGGRTTDLAVTLIPLPNGIIVVEAHDAKSDDTIAASRILGISASGSGITRAAVSRDGRWEIDDLPDGMYTVSGTARGYKTATTIAVGPTAKGTTVDAVLRFEPQVNANLRPSKCVSVDGLEKPRIAKARICLILVATEFEDRFFRGKLQKDEGGAIANDTYRVAARRNAAGERGARYVTATGEIVFRDRERFAKMTRLEELSKEVRRWLSEWSAWLAADLAVPAIAKEEPFIVVNPRYMVPRESAQVPLLPAAYAVFGPLAVPLSIRVENDLTRLPVRLSAAVLPWVSIGTFESLARADIVDLNDLAWSWRELVVDATGDPPDTAPYLIADGATAVASVNAVRGYYPGLTPRLDAALRKSGFPTDLSLANANVTRLAELLSSRGAAVRLIAEARQIVPRDAWSIEALPLAEDQVNELKQRGIESKGELVDRAKDAAGKAFIVEALGLDAPNATKRDEVINPVINEALSGLARYAIELAPTVGLARWEGMDPVTATLLESSGISTVEQLARAGEPAVALAGNMTPDAAKALVGKAQKETIASANVESILALGSASSTKLSTVFGGTKPTVGAILTKDAVQLADALGGEGRAGSILKGLSQGLTNRGIG
ncbi:hypothetical protein BH11GEM2_BH11GEM2_15550 [soil metagenome]